MDDFPGRRRHTVSGEFLFRGNFVESEAALGDAFPGVGDAAIFENLLHLTVFAEGAVQGDECQLNVVRQGEVGILDVDFGHDCA